MSLPTSTSRSLLRPRDVLDHIHDITPDFLGERGLHGLLLDLDNTLIPYGSYEERADVMRWVANLRRMGVRLYLLSNATGKRARFWLDKLGFEGVGMAGKPNPRAFHRALGELGLPAWQVGMVGDQLFTDVLGGNLAGMHTILVRPLAVNALPHTRVTRKLERAVLKRYGHDWRPSVPPVLPGHAPAPAPIPIPDRLNSRDKTHDDMEDNDSGTLDR